MPLFKTVTAAVYGIEASLVEIEVDLQLRPKESESIAAFTMVGLPDAAVRESRERIRAAITNCGYFFPQDRMTVNLAPADVRKEGSSFDLPIAVGILGASGSLKLAELTDTLLLGELALDGRIRPVRGALPAAIKARTAGLKRVIVPAENAREAAVVKGLETYPVRTLGDVVNLLEQESVPPPLAIDVENLLATATHYSIDFQEVKGQLHAKRALEVACAGGHNILLIGPPGSGKTMLARRVPTILPTLTFEEAIEVTQVHSVMGMVDGGGLLAIRPFRAPHHTTSDVGLIGGGSIPRPGEVSLAHNGVLFLDELPEFPRTVLEVLRQPCEDGLVTISRAAMSLTFPSRFMLVTSMNPCPCGYFGSPIRACSCSPLQIQRYVSKISGPLLDRIDIHIEVPAVKFKELGDDSLAESSTAIRTRVEVARTRQLARFANERIYANAQMPPRLIRQYCRLSRNAKVMLEQAIQRLGLSARAYDRILKVSRTIADLAESDEINETHLAEAIQYRSLDRNYWS
ncbi:MAG: YifB family Mg chelatase-like AAA ATPase [Acidobacteriota bacterium]